MGSFGSGGDDVRPSSGAGRRALLAGALGAVGVGSVGALSGCVGPQADGAGAAASGRALDAVRTTKKLKAAYILYPPFVSRDANSGALSGLFIDLMQDISAAGDFAIDYVEAKWGTMVAGLESRQFDLVVSGVFPTIPRGLVVDFADPQMYVGLSGVVAKTNTALNSASDLQRPGLKIAVINGEVGHEYVRRYLPQAEPLVIDAADISRALEEVKSGRAEVSLTESITAVLYAEQNPTVKVVFGERPLQTFGSTVMLRQEDAALKTFLNSAFSFLQSSGRLDELDQKYRNGRPLWLLRAPPWRQGQT
jgi:polar amino acid transport system substrate-binding protein